MTDMRKLIDIVETINNSEKIDEAGFIGRMANKGLAKLGNKKAQGRTDKDALSKRLSDNYYRWLGRTNKKGTLADIQEFLQQVNFTNEQINQITKPVIRSIEQNPQEAEQQNTNNEKQTKQNESIINELNANDFVLSSSEVNTVLDNAAAYAFDKGLYGKNNNQSNNNNNISKNSNSSTQQNNTNTPKQQNNDNEGTRGSGTVTRANLFTKPVLNVLTDLGVSDGDIKNMIGDSQMEKFANLDTEGKEKLAAIAYAILRYNKTGLQ